MKTFITRNFEELIFWTLKVDFEIRKTINNSGKMKFGIVFNKFTMLDEN